MTRQRKRFTELIKGWPVRYKPFLELANISQKELAYILGVEPAAITSYFSLRNQPSIGKVMAMLKAVGYPPPYHVFLGRGDLDQIRTGMIARKLVENMADKEEDDFITLIRGIVGDDTELKNLILFTANVLKNKPDEEGLAELIINSFSQKTVEGIVKTLFSKMLDK